MMAYLILFIMCVGAPLIWGTYYLTVVVKNKQKKKQVLDEIETLPPLIKEAVRIMELMVKTNTVPPDQIQSIDHKTMVFKSLDITLQYVFNNLRVCDQQGKTFDCSFFSSVQQEYITELMTKAHNIYYEDYVAKRRARELYEFNEAFTRKETPNLDKSTTND